MATFFSTQRTKVSASPAQRLKPNEASGRVRAAFFDYTAPASGTPGIGDTIELTQLPVGARVVGGFLTWGTGTAASTLAVGVAGTTGKYLAATAITTAGVARIAEASIATFGLETTADEVVVGTVAGAIVAASQVIKGVLYYVLD